MKRLKVIFNGSNMVVENRLWNEGEGVSMIIAMGGGSCNLYGWREKVGISLLGLGFR